MHNHMLVRIADLDSKGSPATVNLHADDLSTKTQRRRKLEFRRRTVLDVEHDFIQYLTITEIEYGISSAHVMNGKRGPVGGNVWSEDSFVSSSVRLQSKKSPK